MSECKSEISNIAFTTTAKLLGINLDRELSFKQHAKYLKRSCIYHIRQMRCIKRLINKKASVALINALVMSQIDYCNSLFSGCNDDTVADMQSILNAAARMVCGIGRFNHISSTLKELHWLPVQHRIVYKTAVTTYRCLAGSCPPYLMDMISSAATNNRRPGLRSAERGYLITPRSHTNRLSLHSFCHSPPPVWNSLLLAIRLINSDEPSSLSQFCKALKTHLFSLS